MSECVCVCVCARARVLLAWALPRVADVERRARVGPDRADVRVLARQVAVEVHLRNAVPCNAVSVAIIVTIPLLLLLLYYYALLLS